MRTNLNPRTEWEIEAARRRERIDSEAATQRLLRADREPAPEEPAVTEPRRVRWSDVARSLVSGR